VLALVLGVGVLRDLASASAVRAGLGFYDAAARALRSARKAGGRAVGEWAWRSALGVLGVGLAAWAAPPLAGASKGAVAIAVAMHQAAIVGLVLARASWLAAALRLHDRTEPVALMSLPEPEPTAPPPAPPEAAPPEEAAPQQEAAPPEEAAPQQEAPPAGD
jgi:hypothetical protein